MRIIEELQSVPARLEYLHPTPTTHRFVSSIVLDHFHHSRRLCQTPPDLRSSHWPIDTIRFPQRQVIAIRLQARIPLHKLVHCDPVALLNQVAVVPINNLMPRVVRIAAPAWRGPRGGHGRAGYGPGPRRSVVPVRGGSHAIV